MAETAATVGLLGNNTKSSPPQTTSKPGGARDTDGKNPSKIPGENRQLRYLLQDAAKSLMLGQVPDDLEGVEALNEAHRVCKCRRTRVAPDVKVFKSKEFKSAHYGGLSICGSVWACPVCAARIQEGRREEIAQAVDWAYKNGYTVTMVTFTFPHYDFQTCSDLLEKQAAAFKKLRQGSPWTRFKEKIGFVGLIRSLEVNKGLNGWHPHTHELWIHKPLNNKKSQDWFNNTVHYRWKKCCKSVGLIPWGKSQAFNRYATDFKFKASNSDYLAKLDDTSHWGIDREMTKSGNKESFKGLPPFGLLFRYAQGDKQAGAAFLEYVESFHGKRQIFWSQGLKKLIGLTDKSDNDLAEEQKEDADLIIKMEMWAWRQVCMENARELILTLAEEGGYASVSGWLSDRGLTDYGDPTW